jgi:hypothetical protein
MEEQDTYRADGRGGGKKEGSEKDKLIRGMGGGRRKVIHSRQYPQEQAEY